MNYIKFIMPCIFAMAFFCCAFTEKEALVIALKNNTTIQISFIKSQIDSLSLEQLKSQCVPSIDLASTASYSPMNSSIISDSSNPALSTQSSINVSQSLPYGAIFNAGIAGATNKNLKTDSVNSSTQYSVGITQPLLKNAWKNAPLNFSIEIQKLDHAQFSLEQKKELLSTLSDIRLLFWSWYEKSALVRISENNVDLTTQQLTYDRKRFVLGDASEIDTLNATLEFLKAQHNLLSARTAFTLAKKDLANALQINPDSLSLPTDTAVSLGEIPSSHELFHKVREYDPQVKIFQLLRKKIELQIANDRNQLLPQLDLNANYQYIQNGDNLFSQKDFFSKNAVLSLIFKYSIPDVKSRITIKQSNLSQKQTIIEEGQYFKTLEKQIDELVFSWEQERLNLGITQTSKIIALKNLSATQKAYEVGSVDHITIMKAYNDYFSSSVSYIQELISLKKLEITFDEISGNVEKKLGVILK